MSMPDSYRLGLIGFPLAHSLSPCLHTAALHALGLAGEYRLYPVSPLPPGRTLPPGSTLPQGHPVFDDLLEQLRCGELHGLNVTIPYKQAVLASLDERSPAVQAIGAANTLYSREGRLVGENTDAAGFRIDLDRLLAGRDSASPRRALVLGAGGSARAVVYSLLQTGWQVRVAARRIEQAQALVAQFILQAAAGRLLALELERVQPEFDLLVNATPLGMWPAVEGNPWLEGLPLPPQAAVYDLVYNPAETALVRQARLAGLPAMSGLGMLVEQAARAFELWTARPAPRAAMWRAANGALHSPFECDAPGKR